VEPEFLYIVHAWVCGDQAVVGVYDSRSLAEHAVKTQVLDLLEEQGLAAHKCDYFTVDQWTLNAPVIPENCRTLTSYTNRGQLNRILIPYGAENQEDVEVSRIQALLEDDF
jgi:hypothetical protein